jgi:hypothetical protein
MMAPGARGIAMSPIIRAGFALSWAAALSGCFKSDAPLITVFDSVAPIPEGTYTYLGTDQKEEKAVITRELTVTKLITYNGDGNPVLQTLLMRAVGEGYYVVMDAQQDYSLIQIKDGAVLEYDESRYCDDLRDAAEEEGGSLSDYDAEANGADESSICTFSSFDGLVRAFQTLDNHGSLDVAREYHSS